MEDFSSILKKLRKNNGITQDELAQRLGIRKTTISNYETGYSSPSKETLMELATIFNVSMDHLLGRKLALHEKNIDELNSNHSYSIPILGFVHDGKQLFEKFCNKYINVPRDFLSDNDCFALVVDSDEMNLSRIEKGDTIIIQKQPFAQNGDIALLYIHNEQTEIGLFYQKDNQVTLMPNSSNKNNEPKLFDLSDQEIIVLGKVVKAIISIL